MPKRAATPVLAIKPIVTFVILCAIVVLAVAAGRVVRCTYTPSEGATSETWASDSSPSADTR